jgi:hypothetical protein
MEMIAETDGTPQVATDENEPTFEQRKVIAFGVNCDLRWFRKNHREVYRIRRMFAGELLPVPVAPEHTHLISVLCPGVRLDRYCLTQHEAAVLIARHKGLALAATMARKAKKS